MTIHRGSAHYRLSLAGGGTDLGEGEGLCITLSLPWKCHVTRTDVYRPMGQSLTHDPDWDYYDGYAPTNYHPILRHLPNVEPQHHFIVTHELPTRVGLGSSAALALAACGTITGALEMDRLATGAGWQDARACGHEGLAFISDATTVVHISHHLRQSLDGRILLFSTGGTHVEARNASALDPIIRALALAEARKLRDEPTLETLAWCMQSQWERKMAHANPEACSAIDAVMRAGAMGAKTTGSRGAGFGVVLTTNREGARDMLVERGARVWLV